MKTKQQVIDFVRSEGLHGNSIVFSSHGQGGSGLSITDPSRPSEIESLISLMEECTFEGLKEIKCDIWFSDYFQYGCESYQFRDKSSDFHFQVVVDECDQLNEVEKIARGFLPIRLNWVEDNLITSDVIFEWWVATRGPIETQEEQDMYDAVEDAIFAEIIAIQSAVL